MKDPIVEEVRRIKEAQAAKFGFNVRAIGEYARSRQWDSGHKVVRWDAQRGRFLDVKKPAAPGRRKALASK